MKKLIITVLLFLSFTGIVNSQSHFKTNVNVILRGNYSVWLSDSSFKNYYKAFPGIQLEGVVNISPQFGIYGTFAADFLPPKDSRATEFGTTLTEKNSTQLAGYVGPRYYFNKPGKTRVYADAGLGIYSFKFGDFTAKSGDTTFSLTSNSFSQFGFNIGAGANFFLSPQVFINVMAKYHNIPKKTGVVIRETATLTVGSVTTSIAGNLPPVDIPSRSFLQFGLGIGFNFIP